MPACVLGTKQKFVWGGPVSTTYQYCAKCKTELEKYIEQHPYEDDKSLVLGFLKTHPDILAETISTLCMMNYRSVESLMHKINVKDYFLETLKGWITGTTYKDGEFHPEYRDKMVENIDAAMNIEDSTY